jgi:pimeloyl-ACP methyl ester carboxylesterase
MLDNVKRTTVTLLAIAALALPTARSVAQPIGAEHVRAKGVTNIVLVHGAFADGSSWSKVIPLLEAKGLTVTAVQNPLTSLNDDVAATKRALDAQDGRVLLVGHSYAGAVISQAGTDSKVAGLVFVAAGAPNAGQSFSEMSQGFPTPPGPQRAKADASGFVSLPRAAVAEDFAPDLPRSESDVLAATQGPTSATCFSTKITNAAWETKPSWFLVARQDRMIDPNLERALAKKIKAATLEIDSSHVPMLSHPDRVASFIADAASRL